MKRLFQVFFVVAMILTSLVTADAHSMDNSDFSMLFEEHGANMLLIDPESGDILYANKAAVDFYGYSKAGLLSMQIDQINMLSPQETAANMMAAEKEDRNYFVFPHRLASGEIRTVEVYSYPVMIEGKDFLYSIIYDITDKVNLENQRKQTMYGIYAVGSIAILLLLFLLVILLLNNRKLKQSKLKIDNYTALIKTFIDADRSLVYLKDENLNYVLVNHAFEEFYQKEAEEVIGHDDYMLSDLEFAEKRRETDLNVLETGTLITDDEAWKGRIYRITKFPVRMLNGRLGVGAYKTDITEERERERRQNQVLSRHMILTDVFTHYFSSRKEQLDYVLHQALRLTESQYGYFYLYDEKEKEFVLNSWTKGVLEECSITEKRTMNHLDQTGLWGEVVRQRKPIVINDFDQIDRLKKGYPEGHVPLKRYLSIPVMIDQKIVAVVGMANKEGEYDENDVYELTLLMSNAWNAVERREAQERLALERNKYLQTLISIGDGVMVVDLEGRIEMLNKVAQKLTGWPFEDAKGQYYKDVFHLSHEQKKRKINDPIEDVMKTDAIQELGNHAVLTSVDGQRYLLEDSAAPIKDENGITVGIVLIFRDVTDKKEQLKRIEYLSYHDPLTGLYNRRFFENELRRLDNARNLPLSIVMGDINGLKLANDIYGHNFGDELLERIADVFRRVCRTDDIVARWGGDEFVLLLTKTDMEVAENIIVRVKEEFAKEQIKAIKGSISMGADTKCRKSDSIEEVLNRAEERMYSRKTLERREVGRNVIDRIISTINDSCPKERDHAFRISELSQRLGRALELPEDDIYKLKEAAFLHDIGKIALDLRMLDRESCLSDDERNELKKHTIIGFRILNSFDDTADLADVVLTHHEKWNGSGYPKGLREEEIPLLARIISIVENYDSLLSGLEKGQIESREEIAAIIRKNEGNLFDPQLAEKFAEIVAAGLF